MRITAGGAIVKGERILLGLRAAQGCYYSGCWDIFGGHCEAGETPEETLSRELQEELGISPEKFSLLALYDEPHPEIYGEGKHYFFAVTEWRGEPNNLGSEHDEIRWFTLSDLEKVKLASEEYREIFKPLL
jgi:8-oxo-dGTP diphosphatase